MTVDGLGGWEARQTGGSRHQMHLEPWACFSFLTVYLLLDYMYGTNIYQDHANFLYDIMKVTIMNVAESHGQC